MLPESYPSTHFLSTRQRCSILRWYMQKTLTHSDFPCRTRDRTTAFLTLGHPPPASLCETLAGRPTRPPFPAFCTGKIMQHLPAPHDARSFPRFIFHTS